MRRVIQTTEAPGAIGPYSQAIHIEPFLYTAGQIGLDPATGKLVAGGVEAEARQALRNVQAIVEAAGGRLEDVVKATVFLTRMADFKAVNAVYGEFFPEHPPARSAVAVVELPAGASVEIEAIAHWR
ncbi:MAG: RidA family protein [Candidatus Latescibacterota bacterium]|nr:MAG: RidA family protein [Candidatus Latescibacterota bacterium]